MIVKPFKGLRPPKEDAKSVAALPYDVINSEEARELAKGNEKSFLHVTKPEIDLDHNIDLYDDKVYAKAAENFEMFQKNGWLKRDETECLYIYRQIMNKKQQTGLVACVSSKEYWDGKIKKHEFTRKAKEEDRLRHVDTINANAGPVFLTYLAQNEIDEMINKVTASEPEYDFTSEDGITHVFWVVKDENWINLVREHFNKVPAFYIADGHHRAQAAARIAQVRAEKSGKKDSQEHNQFFMAVLFPDKQLHIMPYNRAVKDLNSKSKEDFIKAVEEKFEVEKTECKEPVEPATFGMYLDGCWYKLTAKPSTFPAGDPVKSLDVSILQNNLLEPVLGIQDPRTDNRIDFIGGIRGVKELEKIVNEKKFEVAFSMYPTSIHQLMDIANAGEVMPPKSTWFEPKLRSGLIVNTLD